MGDAKENRAAIGKEAVNPIRDGDADEIHAEIVAIDESGGAFLPGSGIIECAGKLLLSCIDADDWLVSALEVTVVELIKIWLEPNSLYCAGP
jgi:hypothetical protein